MANRSVETQEKCDPAKVSQTGWRRAEQERDQERRAEQLSVEENDSRRGFPNRYPPGTKPKMRSEPANLGFAFETTRRLPAQVSAMNESPERGRVFHRVKIGARIDEQAYDRDRTRKHRAERIRAEICDIGDIRQICGR